MRYFVNFFMLFIPIGSWSRIEYSCEVVLSLSLSLSLWELSRFRFHTKALWGLVYSDYRVQKILFAVQGLCVRYMIIFTLKHFDRFCVNVCWNTQTRELEIKTNCEFLTKSYIPWSTLTLKFYWLIGLYRQLMWVAKYKHVSRLYP